MLEGLAPDLTSRLAIAIGGVALAFIILIAVLVFLKRKNSPLFIKGGRGREHRLVVLDAAAVDAKRRLVLIRRDDTEHLIMIGGPTDIVIETGISGTNRQKPAEAAVLERPLAADSGFAADARAALAAVSGRAPEAHKPPARPVPVKRPPESTIQPADAKGISAMGSVLYDEDRELFGGETPRPSQASAAVQVPGARTPAIQSPVTRPEALPLAAQAEDMLGQARMRVLPPQVQAEDHKAAADDAAIKAMADRLEAARIEGLRLEAAKIEAARLDAQRVEAQRVEAEKLQAERLQAERADAARIDAQRADMQRRETQRLEAQRQEAERLERERADARRLESARLRAEAEKRAQAEETERRAQAEESPRRSQAERERIEPALNQAYAENLSDQSRDTLASDFEKLLEVELQRGGIINDGAAPDVEIEPRDAAPRAAYPVPRESSNVVTGAMPGPSVEQDMARRLGEITLNKKTDQL